MSDRLSRLEITGKINENTPSCVLIEIMKAHGISYDENKLTVREILTKIRAKEVPITPRGDNVSKEEWQFIARFVNSDVKYWELEGLSKAYKFLYNFIGTETDLPDKFKTGQQTPEDIESINACVLYKFCKKFGIEMDYDTTIDEMVEAIKLSKKTDKQLINLAKKAINDDSFRSKLISMLIKVGDNEDKDVVDIDHNKCPNDIANFMGLQKIINTLNNTSELRYLIKPQTFEGAIALSALNYKVDISKARDPIDEYKHLKNLIHYGYTPKDKWMKYWYDKNHGMFDLTKFFNPIFPETYYDNKILTYLAKKEGYSLQEINGSRCYELLQQAYLSETFYSGHLPNIARMETIIDLEKIMDVPNGQLLCFGVMGSKLEPITIIELIHTFKSMGFFGNPFELNMSLSEIAVKKLKIMLGTNGKSYSSETLQLRSYLLNLMNTIETKNKTMDNPTRDLCLNFRNASSDTKLAIVTSLTKLLHMAMYMRGWDGVNKKFPISECLVPEDQSEIVILNVSLAILEYETSCRCLGKLGQLINSLPLVKHNDGKYYPSTEYKDGFTIGDRLTIVKTGTETSNMSSCIRLSSNWFCASAHKYLLAIGQPPPFDIFYLRHIS